jgi:tetratricopeptide (TPR) repeat protein
VRLERVHLAHAQGQDARAAEETKALAAEGGALELLAAEQLLAAHRCKGTVSGLQAVARARPSAEALRSFGWALLLCGHEPIRAAGAFRAAQGKDPADEGAQLGEAWALLAMPRSPEALELATRKADAVLSRNPAQVSAILARAAAHRKKGEFDQAEQWLARVPATHPARGEADNLRALLALDREDPYGALRILRELVASRPDLPHPRLNLALAFVRSGQSAEARRVLDEIIAKLPEFHPMRTHAQRVLGSVRSR